VHGSGPARPRPFCGACVEGSEEVRDARFLAEKAQHKAATATIGSEAVMGSGSASKAPESALWKGEAEPRYRCFRITYPSGTTFDSWWLEGGGTLLAVQIEHPLAQVEADEGSLVSEADRT
jgi:hypothetical protein